MVDTHSCPSTLSAFQNPFRNDGDSRHFRLRLSNFVMIFLFMCCILQKWRLLISIKFNFINQSNDLHPRKSTSKLAIQPSTRCRPTTRAVADIWMYGSAIYLWVFERLLLRVFLANSSETWLYWLIYDMLCLDEIKYMLISGRHFCRSLIQNAQGDWCLVTSYGDVTRKPPRTDRSSARSRLPILLNRKGLHRDSS